MSCIGHILLSAALSAAGEGDRALDLRTDPVELRSEVVDPVVDPVVEPAQEAGKPDHRQADKTEFSIGPAVGYQRIRDADEGTWFVGIQARVRFLRYLGLEGAILFHRDEFADGDVEVTTYPVQVTALVFPFPDSPIEPYGLFGAGWYYSRFDFDDSLGGGDETDRNFGFHAGAGAQIEIGDRLHVFGDFRWIFMDESGVDNSDIEDEEFDTWMITLGLSVRF